MSASRLTGRRLRISGVNSRLLLPVQAGRWSTSTRTRSRGRSWGDLTRTDAIDPRRTFVVQKDLVAFGDCLRHIQPKEMSLECLISPTTRFQRFISSVLPGFWRLLRLGGNLGSAPRAG